MATRIATILSEKSSTNALTSGLALTNELANQAFPEGSSKRSVFNLTNQAGTVGAGTTPLELFIDGVANFRLRPADTSTMLVEIHATYCASGAATSAVHHLRAGLINRAGTVTILADSLTNKMPNASTTTVALTIVASQLVVTCTGAAGDTNGRWKARVTVTEVTDLG